MFSIPRLIDWDRVTGFQRRHFAFTSGCGLVLSPVNEIDSAGRPRFIAGDIPQRGITPPLAHSELYFGDDRAPWAMVDTSQNQFVCLKNQTTTWAGNGIKVGDHRLALSLFLGGLPLIGGGRQFWNSTDGNPAGGDAQALLYRGMRTRLERLAPFLEWDSAPYYAAADGHVYVIDVGYAATDRLPYSEVVQRRPLPAVDGDRRHGRLLGRDEAVRARPEGADHGHLDEGLPRTVHVVHEAARRACGRTSSTARTRSTRRPPRSPATT